MKKARNGFIKNLHYLCLVGVIALGLMAIVGTGEDTGGDGGIVSSGTAPEIYNVELFNTSDPNNPTTSFTIGDYYTFKVYAKDPDLDLIHLYVTQYYPDDSNSPFYGPDTKSLSSQLQADVTYNFGPGEITGPAGSWRIEFQLQDSRGNMSNVWTVYSETSSTAQSLETEPNNDMDHADSLVSGESIIGQLSSESDEDWFSITTSGAAVINASFHIDTAHNFEHWDISIKDASGNALASVSCCADNNETELRAAVTEPGTYYIIITYYNLYSDDTYTLTVWLS